MNILEIPDIQPYSLKKADKEKFLSNYLTSLSRHHYACCAPYRKMMDGIGFDSQKDYHYQDLPFLPVQLFKMIELCSVPKEDVVKTLTSSGTSGQMVSQIFLDKVTSANQIKVLMKIVSSFLGTKRVPMIIIDSDNVVSNRNFLSAHAAGITGFSLFGSKRMYALNEQMELNLEQLKAFTEQNKGERIFIFGFTFMVYQHFYKKLIKAGVKLDFSNAVLIHGGGWKKLERESVSSKEFREKLNDICGIRSVHDYYGMVEQTGTIYMECEYGHYHASVFSDILVRRAHDFSMADLGEEGIIQVLSILPNSYPGHSLLTDDNGTWLGEDDCPCGRLGKYFKIVGRLKNAEIKGCSDIYEEKSE
jgi:phenylacetate-coenzyme A ligase PaaK-like adenylate-forming protein